MGTFIEGSNPKTNAPIYGFVPGCNQLETAGGFSDVFENHCFADPVVWAVEKNITGGVTAETVVPERTCTRGQIATFLYRAFAG